MKTVLILAALVACAAAWSIPTYKTKTVDADFIAKQQKVFSLLKRTKHADFDAEYYKYGAEYVLEEHKSDYTDPKVVENFLHFWKYGHTEKSYVFSIFNDKQRPEAIALYDLFYYAKDFETFYKTAAFAKVHLNEGIFVYAYYLAVFHRADTQGMLLPSPYEMYPEYFLNKDVIVKMQRTKMQDGIFNEEDAHFFGITKENNNFVFSANYSNYLVYNNEEQKLAYFTEDVALNAYYYYFNTYFPFWMQQDKNAFLLKDRMGELKFYIYNQLLNRYYLERLSNGLGEIPHFSWYEPIKTGYCPALQSPFYPFMMRNNDYYAYTEKNYESIRFLDTYEKTFDYFMQAGFFTSKDKVYDMYNSKSFEWVTKYWLVADKHMFENNFERNYEVIARRVLGAAPEPTNYNEFFPTTLDFFSTSVRDPMFYQMYNRINQYVLQTIKLWKPYTSEYLRFPGVKINDFQVDKLTTFFEMFEFDATNAVYHNSTEYHHENSFYKVRQPRLNHKPFTVTANIKSDVDTKATVKFFIGPKYDSYGNVLTLEDNWMNFFQLDWFNFQLKSGANTIVRKSSEFMLFSEDKLPVSELDKVFKEGKMPEFKNQGYHFIPDSLMLPKGRHGGYPFQFFMIVYPGEEVPSEYGFWKSMVKDTKHFMYPFDRPVKEDYYFKQPNVFFKDVLIYHEDSFYPTH